MTFVLAESYSWVSNRIFDVDKHLIKFKTAIKDTFVYIVNKKLERKLTNLL